MAGLGKVRGYYDLHLEGAGASKYLQMLGWDGGVLCVDCKHGQRRPEAKGLLTAACIGGDFQKNARTALDSFDLVYAKPDNDKALREACECWEVDMILHASGSLKLDSAMAKLAAEREIAFEINLSVVLEAYGVRRSSILNALHGNLILARKYGMPVVLSSGARGEFEARSPKDMVSFAVLLGLPKDEAVRSVSDNPMELVSRAARRADPNVLLGGLRVVSWGQTTPTCPKRKWGWY
ncbi:MAG: RNase P subunit p30 family protein [Candidatus Altiarchaeota archaeon]